MVRRSRKPEFFIIIDGVRHPIKATFGRLIAEGVLPAEFPNPGAELGEWVGKKRQKKDRRHPTYFPSETAVALLKRTADDYPRRYAFLATGMLAGLRWGESVALQAGDIRWDEGVICIERTWSEKSKVVNPAKDSDARRVPLTKELRRALLAHQQLLDSEGYKGSEVTFVDRRGRRETRAVRLMFPNQEHRIAGSSGAFYEHNWTKMQREMGLQPIKYHATRHSFATWALGSQEPAHKVRLYLGHATIQQTLGTYYHALIGNQGELGGMERMLELDHKAVARAGHRVGRQRAQEEGPGEHPRPLRISAARGSAQLFGRLDRRRNIDSSSCSCAKDSTMFIACPCSASSSRARRMIFASPKHSSHGVGSLHGAGCRRCSACGGPWLTAPVTARRAPLVTTGHLRARRRLLLRLSPLFVRVFLHGGG